MHIADSVCTPTRHVRHLCRNISVDTFRYEVARGHCDRRPRHCCMSHSDERPSANVLSALQHHLSGTLSLSPFRTATRLHYLNLDLRHICSPPSICFLTVLFASASEATATWRFTNFVLNCTGWAKKVGHRLMATILSNLNRLKKFHWNSSANL